MSKEIEYTEAPEEAERALDEAKIIPDFLPAPSELIRKEPPAEE